MDKLFLEFEVFEMRSDELVAVACALVFSSCRNGELDRPQDASPASETRIIALRAGIDDCFASDADTRASYDDAGALIWSAGDAISVIVPIYKVEAHIGKCARSLFEQTFPELFFTVITDKTISLSDRIKYYLTLAGIWPGLYKLALKIKNRI